MQQTIEKLMEIYWQLVEFDESELNHEESMEMARIRVKTIELANTLDKKRKGE